MNDQPIEKQSLLTSGDLYLHHIFISIQGEGPLVGQPAVFVRLYGCNLQCPLCDTDYTSRCTPTSAFKLKTIIDGLTGPSKLVVFTGGEPFRQNLVPAIDLLYAAGYRIQIETNGTLSISDFDPEKALIVCSPKTGKVSSGLIDYITAYKYVISDDSIDPDDGLPIRALNHPVSGKVARPPAGFDRRRIYVQPADVNDPIQNKRNTDAAIRSCMLYGYTLCLQTHKIIGLE